MKKETCSLLSAATLTLVGIVNQAAAADSLSTWHTRTSPYGTTNDWRGIVFANGQFVTCGSRGLIATSPDGVDWSPRAADTTRHFYSVAFGNGIFVATGQSGTVFTSTDGANWQAQDPDSNAHLYHVNYNNDRFVTVGGGGVILSSPNGETWTPHNTGSTNQWEASCYGNGTHVVVGYRTQTPNSYTRTAVSPTLADWDLVDSGALFYLSGVTFGQGKFVAVGYGGLVQNSTDGVIWSDPATPTFEWLYFTVYANNTFLAAGEDLIVSSENGVNWTNRYRVSGVYQSAAFGNNTWVVVGNDSVILQSDPVTGTPPSNIILSNANRQGNQFSFTFNCEAGQNYEVQATTDFNEWTTVTNLVGAGSSTSCTLGNQTMPSRSYRVVKPPGP